MIVTMKVRTGFVSNSSSSSFVVFSAFNNELASKLMKEAKDKLYYKISLIDGSLQNNCSKDFTDEEVYALRSNESNEAITIISSAKTFRSMHEIENFIKEKLIAHYNYMNSYDDDDKPQYEQYDLKKIATTSKELAKILIEQSNNPELTSFPIKVCYHTYTEPEGYGTLWGIPDEPGQPTESYDTSVKTMRKNGFNCVEYCTHMCI